MCCVPEKADETVIVEDATALKQFKETYEAKYQEEIETSQYIAYAV
jgi:hypothetical protein